MMKRLMMYSAWLLAAILLLPGCASGSQTGSGGAADVSNTAVQDQSGEEQEAIPAQNSKESSGEEREMPYAFPIVREENVSVELLAVRDAEKGERKYYLRYENRSEEDLMVTLSHLRINGHILAAADETLFMDAGESDTEEFSELRENIFAAERAGEYVETVTGTVAVNSWETDEKGDRIVLYEGPVEVLFPEGFEPRVICEPTLSMRAEEQILKDDGQVRITLTQMGKFVGSGSYYVLQGILRIENLSDQDIPIRIGGIRVNGYYFELNGTRRGDLSAGNVLYSSFYCSSSDFENAGIEEIESVELQILSSREEDVGTIYGVAGGSWYPVELAEHGTAGENGGIQVQVYEDDYIVVEFIGAETEWNEYSDGSGSGHYSWDFSFTNKTDKELRITFEDFIIDGQQDTGGFGDRYFLLCDLGANSRTKEDVWRSIEGPSPLPEISFRVQIKSAGGGSLYNYSEEYVTITKEMVEQVSVSEEEPETAETDSAEEDKQ